MDRNIIKVEWLGKSRQSASELLDADGDQFENSQLEEACYVLYLILAEADGEIPAKTVVKEAASALVSLRTLKRAKKRLGVRSYRKWRAIDGNKKTWEWVWRLPADAAVIQPYQDRARAEQDQDIIAASQDLIVPSEPVGAECSPDHDMKLHESDQKTDEDNSRDLIVPTEPLGAVCPPDQGVKSEQSDQGSDNDISQGLIVPGEASEATCPPDHGMKLQESHQETDGDDFQDLIVPTEPLETACSSDQNAKLDAPSQGVGEESGHESCCRSRTTSDETSAPKDGLPDEPLASRSWEE